MVEFKEGDGEVGARVGGGRAVAGALWAALSIAAGLGCWLTLARLLKLNFRDGSFLLLPLAHFSCVYFFQWDLRSANCNLIFLAALLLGVLCLTRERPRAAGFWLALAFSLKLFSVLVQTAPPRELRGALRLRHAS